MKGYNNSLKIALILFVGLLLGIFNNCSDIGNPPIGSDDQLKSDGGTVVGNPISTENKLVFSAYDVSPLSDTDQVASSICISRISFLEGNESNGSESQFIQIGRVDLKPEGVEFAEVELNIGTYRKAEILIKANCLEDFSVSVSNLQGNFSTREDVELKFRGPFTISNTSTIIFNIGQLMKHLSQINDGEMIDEAFQNFDGSLQVVE